MKLTRKTAAHALPPPLVAACQVANRYFVHVGHLPGEEHRRVHHIAIRGTVSLADLSIDLKIRQVFDEECGCLFHAGFKEVADVVADDVVQFLEDGAKVKIAGHSLGGAVAIIVAAKLRLRGYDVEKVMTFGAPMVTDAAGAALLRDFLPVMRVTHERDPIPLTPLSRAKVSPTENRVQESEAGVEANPSRAEAWVDSAATDNGREEAQATTDLGGVLEEEVEEEEEEARKKRTDDAARWRVGSSSAYSHFGSHVRRDGLPRVVASTCRKMNDHAHPFRVPQCGLRVMRGAEDRATRRFRKANAVECCVGTYCSRTYFFATLICSQPLYLFLRKPPSLCLTPHPASPSLSPILLCALTPSRGLLGENRWCSCGDANV